MDSGGTTFTNQLINMKKILLFFVLLTTATIGFARNVQIHLTDLRGTAMSNMTIEFLGDYMKTDADGNFTITGLTSGGTYSFNCRGNDFSGDVSFDWDGGSPTVNVQLPGCLITLVLTGLNEEEILTYGNHYITLYPGSDGGFHSTTARLYKGTYTTWWKSSTLQWEFTETALGGTTKSEVIDLLNTTGPILVDPLAGKVRVTMGTVTGHDGKPVTDYTINGFRSTDFPDGKPSWWSAPGENFYRFSAKGYYSFSKEYTVGSDPLTLDLDMSTFVGVTVQAKDRDDSPLADAYILTNQYQGDTLGITDPKGEYTFYTLPKDYIIIALAADKPMYPVLAKDFHVGSEDQTITIGYEGFHLISTRIIGGARFIAPYKEWNGEMKWPQNAKVMCRKVYESGNDYESSNYELSYEQQGEDIIVGTLIDNSENEWQEARLDLTFLNASPRILPVEGTYAPLTGDIYAEYDLTNHTPVTLKAPEGFRFNNDNLKVDGQEVYRGWDTQQALTLYMPQGEHNWVPQLRNEADNTQYPYGKPQSFTVGTDSIAITYPFDINNYSAVRFTVLDKDGKPFQNMGITVYDSSTSSYNPITRTNTNAEGQVTVFLSGPGTYYWITDPSNNYGVSQKGEVEVGESLASQTVSYEGWHTLTLSITGKDLSNRLEYASATITGMKSSYISLSSYSDYTASRLFPGTEINGKIRLRGKGYGREVEIPFTLKNIGSDVGYTLNMDTVRAVKFTVNGTPSDYDASITVYQGTRDIVSFDSKESGLLLASGSYYAVLDVYDYAYRDTVYFNVSNEDLTIDFQLNTDDFHLLTFKFINAPTDLSVEHYNINDDEAPEWLPNGTYLYDIYVMFADEKYIATTISGTVNIKDEDVEIVIDLAKYRLFNMDFYLEDGTPYSIDGYVTITSDNVRVRAYLGYESTVMLPIGDYDVTVFNYDDRSYHYGKLHVPSDCPEKITITLSDNADAIEDIPNDAAHTLAATPTADGLHITASGNEPVTVSLYGTNGNLLLNRQAAPGTTVATGQLGKGIYIVQLKQGKNLRTQKLAL